MNKIFNRPREQAEKTADEIRDVLEEHSEISRALSQDIASSIAGGEDEDDLLLELDKLSKEMTPKKQPRSEPHIAAATTPPRGIKGNEEEQYLRDFELLEKEQEKLERGIQEQERQQEELLQ